MELVGGGVGEKPFSLFPYIKIFPAVKEMKPVTEREKVELQSGDIERERKKAYPGHLFNYIVGGTARRVAVIIDFCFSTSTNTRRGQFKMS